MNETTKDYWLTLTGETSIRAIARKSGLDQSKASRQLANGRNLSVETVVAVCRAYGIDMASVFVEVGFITEEEARSFSSVMQLSDYTDLELSREMLRRVEAGTATEAITEPAPTEMVDELARRRAASNVGGDAEDLSKLDEGELESRYDNAAGTDASADRIDPETT